MIRKISPNDITTLDPDEPLDIVVGMNTRLEKLDSILLPRQWQADQKFPLQIGSVLSFQLDRMRKLHMLICHNLGNNGWVDAEKYIRIGMDYLWLKHGNNRDFSIVQIGAGRVGLAGGADTNRIRSAMAESFLPVTLFVKDSSEPADIRKIRSGQLSRPEVWTPLTGLVR
jgi:hypothetical protein